MKSLTEYLWFEVPDRRGYLNITDTVEALATRFQRSKDAAGLRGKAQTWAGLIWRS